MPRRSFPHIAFGGLIVCAILCVYICLPAKTEFCICFHLTHIPVFGYYRSTLVRMKQLCFCRFVFPFCRFIRTHSLFCRHIRHTDTLFQSTKLHNRFSHVNEYRSKTRYIFQHNIALGSTESVAIHLNIDFKSTLFVFFSCIGSIILEKLAVLFCDEILSKFSPNLQK